MGVAAMRQIGNPILASIGRDREQGGMLARLDRAPHRQQRIGKPPARGRCWLSRGWRVGGVVVSVFSWFSSP